jgi:CubicO group peptidase (beta-lactamase class C family)
MEWLLEFGKLTPKGAMGTLATMQLGELFQYSNPMAAAAGYIGGHVAFPKIELGKAYDQAMQTRVFNPLGMTNTTFDFKKAQRGNAAAPHAPDVDGKTAVALNEVNYSVIPVRPAGAAWSNVRDMLKYVQMELAEGKLPNGKQYVSKEALLARREPQVAIGNDATYGMPHSRDEKRRHHHSSRRRHDRLPQRHDVDPGSAGWRGDPDQRRSGLADPQPVPPQAARGSVRREARSGCEHLRGGEAVVRQPCCRAPPHDGKASGMANDSINVR